MSATPALVLADKHVNIVGLGLMGGSLALALRPFVRKLTAVEMDTSTRQLALERGIVESVTDKMSAGAAAGDVIILATPVSTIEEVIKALPLWRPQGCVVMDLGSTKRLICAAMDELPPQFEAVGGHPMCGKETAGLYHADARLYRGCTFALCRTERTSERTEEIVLAILDAVGARPLFLTPDEHDRRVALVSHLPYLVSAALIEQSAVAGATDPGLWQLSASGFRDTSRLAGSDPQMMADILRTNRDAVLQRLRQYAGGLRRLISLLEEDDQHALANWLKTRQHEYLEYRRARESYEDSGS